LRLINLQIQQTKNKGRGVFTTAAISVNQIIEICPVILIPKAELVFLDETYLYNYYFLWNENKDAAIALGYGSLYNHSEKPNATFLIQNETNSIIIKSISTVKIGEEITIDYVAGGGKLWWNNQSET